MKFRTIVLSACCAVMATGALAVERRGGLNPEG